MAVYDRTTRRLVLSGSKRRMTSIGQAHARQAIRSVHGHPFSDLSMKV
jgi:hypothetical protein